MRTLPRRRSRSALCAPCADAQHRYLNTNPRSWTSNGPDRRCQCHPGGSWRRPEHSLTRTLRSITRVDVNTRPPNPASPALLFDVNTRSPRPAGECGGHDARRMRLPVSTRHAGAVPRTAGHGQPRRRNGEPETRRRGHAGTRTRGHAGTRTRGHADTRTRGHADTRTRGHADTRRCGDTDIPDADTRRCERRGHAEDRGVRESRRGDDEGGRVTAAVRREPATRPARPGSAMSFGALAPPVLETIEEASALAA